MKLQRSRAGEVRRVLNQLYPNPPIPLNHKDAFTFLVAVVLSAQTTDGRVNDVTRVLFQKAPTPEMLSKLSVSEVLEIIAPVGLAARKAQYLVNLSQKILQDFDGKVPSTHEALETLPGVGNKTASVIMSQVYHSLHLLESYISSGIWGTRSCCGHPCASAGEQVGPLQGIECR
jgi:endonuclease III